MTTPENSDTLKVDMQGEGQGPTPNPTELGVNPSPTETTNVNADLPSEFSSPILGAGATSEDQPKTLEEAQAARIRESLGLINDLEADGEQNGWYFAEWGKFGEIDTRVLLMQQPVTNIDFGGSGSRNPAFIALTPEGPMAIQPNDFELVKKIIDQRIADQYDPKNNPRVMGGFDRGGTNEISIEAPLADGDRRLIFGLGESDWGTVLSVDHLPEVVKNVILQSREKRSNPHHPAFEEEMKEVQNIRDMRNFIKELNATPSESPQS